MSNTLKPQTPAEAELVKLTLEKARKEEQRALQKAAIKREEEVTKKKAYIAQQKEEAEAIATFLTKKWTEFNEAHPNTYKLVIGKSGIHTEQVYHFDGDDKIVDWSKDYYTKSACIIRTDLDSEYCKITADYHRTSSRGRFYYKYRSGDKGKLKLQIDGRWFYEESRKHYVKSSTVHSKIEEEIVRRNDKVEEERRFQQKLTSMRPTLKQVFPRAAIKVDVGWTRSKYHKNGGWKTIEARVDLGNGLIIKYEATANSDGPFWRGIEGLNKFNPKEIAKALGVLEQPEEKPQLEWKEDLS